MISSCTPRNQNSTGSALMARQIADGHVCDFDHMRGAEEMQVFIPVGSERNYINVPIYLPYDARLDKVKLTSLEMVDSTQLASYGGYDMPSSFVTGWITFMDDCGNRLCEIPLSKLNKVTNGGKNLFFRNMEVCWSKSYLFFTTLPGVATGFLFNLWKGNKS